MAAASRAEHKERTKFQAARAPTELDIQVTYAKLTLAHSNFSRRANGYPNILTRSSWEPVSVMSFLHAPCRNRLLCFVCHPLFRMPCQGLQTYSLNWFSFAKPSGWLCTRIGRVTAYFGNNIIWYGSNISHEIYNPTSVVWNARDAKGSYELWITTNGKLPYSRGAGCNTISLSFSTTWWYGRDIDTRPAGKWACSVVSCIKKCFQTFFMWP